MRNRGYGEWGVANLGDEMKGTRRVTKDGRNRKVEGKQNTKMTRLFELCEEELQQE